MPRKLRIEYPGAMYHVMSRANGTGNIFESDVDRQDFVKTLAETCEKAGFEVHAYCLMRNHFHLVVETPNGNLVAGMRWLLSAYSLRFNPRHRRFGHVFSGRYKALIVDGSTHGYLKTVCDYVHLNPVRAKLLRSEQRLLAYPWSSRTVSGRSGASASLVAGGSVVGRARDTARRCGGAGTVRGADGKATGCGNRRGGVEGDSTGLVSGASGVQDHAVGATGRQAGAASLWGTQERAPRPRPSGSSAKT